MSAPALSPLANQMVGRVPGQVMKDRIVSSADGTPQIRVRRTTTAGARKLLGVPEESVGVNHRMTIGDDRSR